MSDLPLEIKKHHYKKWKGSLFVNPENGDIIQLRKIINRTRGWRKGFNFNFVCLTKGNVNRRSYYALNSRYDEKFLRTLKKITLAEVETMKDDLQTLFK